MVFGPRTILDDPTLRRSRRRRPIAPSLALAVLIGTTAISCDSGRLERLQRAVPRLDVDMARHLVYDDAPAFRSYARRTGFRMLRDAWVAFYLAHDASLSPARFGERRRFLRPLVERINRAFVLEFQAPEYEADCRRRDAMGALAELHLHALDERMKAESRNPATDVEAQLGRLEQIRREFRRLDYARGTMLVEMQMADLVMRRGRLEDRMRLLESAVTHARALGEHYLLCQFLAALGVGDDRVLEEVYRIAGRHRIADQQARALTFMSANAEAHGHWARALDLARQAIRVCRESGGGGLELRYVVEAMELFAKLGCWEVVDRFDGRCEPLARDLTATERASLRGYVLARMTLKARSWMHHGDLDGAQRVFTALATEIKAGANRVQYADLLDQWSAALELAGHAGEALALCEEGVRYCDSLHVDERAASLQLRLARLSRVVGSRAEAWRALADLDRRRAQAIEPDRRLSVAREALVARLHLDAGDLKRARRAARRMLASVAALAREVDGGTSSELVLASLEEARRVAHDVLAPTPISGYRLEMEWRAIVSGFGRPDGLGFESTRGFALPAAGDVHLVFLVSDREIVRWTARSDRVVRDRLQVTRDSCATLVQQALDEMQGSGAPASGPRSAARAMAHLLLPILSRPREARIARVWVSPDGPLAGVPFEALPLDDDPAGRPLASVVEVAYLHSLGDVGPSRAGGVPLIVDDPAIPDETRRRFGWLTRLPAAGREANRVALAWPGARRLRGDSATRANVLAALPHASYLHVAAHLVQDPEVPIATLFPLAAPSPGADDAQAYVDPLDVRGVDLRGCRLVVLSSCASGAPYLASTGISRGMSDAFLDAGAHAVVRTAWSVGDEDAGRFSSEFFDQWERDPGDPIGALHRAQGRLLQEWPQGPWLAWSIAVRGLPSRERRTPIALLSR
jgi:CHAT domain-containing protein